MKLYLTSNFLFYKEKSFESDKLTVNCISNIYEAQIQNSTRSLLRALQPLTKFPLLSIVRPDFNWYIRQLYITGYPKQSKTLEWTSKYGNKQISEIDLTSFEVVELPTTFSMPNGFRFPTMEDYCDIEELDSVAKSWLYSQAQYIDKPDWDSRIKELTVDKLTEIKQFSTLFFGVNEWVTVRDYQFDIDKYIAKCKKMKTLLADDKRNFNLEYLQIKEEIEKWEEIKMLGSPVEVDPEQIYFQICSNILFP